MMGIATCRPNCFVTEFGYMELCAHAIEPGNKIRVLFDAGTLFAVRPTAVLGKCLFMEACYVHGLMDYQAISL